MRFDDIQTQQSSAVQEKFAMTDAIDLHDQLNPKLWTNNKMRPEVKKALLDIAENFKAFLGIEDVEVKDITVSGSNAAFTYTPHSDLDLHLLVDIEKLDASEVYRELFDSKKYQYNDLHDIKIRGVEVELYVQNASEPVVSLGEYSVLHDSWIKEPERKPFTTDSSEVKQKYNELRTRALRALKNKSKSRITSVLDDIKRARKSGLAKGGEFSPENLAFKMLRTQGIIDKLYAAKTEQEDKELSLEARNIAEDVQLNEINMSPSSLRKLAAAIPGARAGMEFEMIVPGVANPEDSEPEADYDQDERCDDFRDIIRFFSGGDDVNSRRDLRTLEEQLDEEFMDWSSEEVDRRWNNDMSEYIRDYINLNDEFDRDGAIEQAREEFAEANPDIDLDSEEAQQGISARADELEEEFISEVISEGYGNRVYDRAFEEYQDEVMSELDQGEFLRDKGYRYMSDIESNFDIRWPYYTYGGGDGDVDVHSVGEEFSDWMGKKVNASTSYHGGKREPGAYVVEPDGSLDADDDSDSGLEFVSPPLPIAELLSDLDKVKRWAEEKGCYTNDSTGLHINVSVPGYSLDKLDYIKLALLMGDEYILREFGRQANTYCKSAIKFIREKATPETVDVAMKKMKEQLNTSVSKLIHSGITNKYTSINTKDSYVEFRSAGGDWLNEDLSKLENTLLRFVVALDASIDESKYKEEYAKKLYKLIAPADDTINTLQYFAKYSAGEIPKAALRSFIKQAQLQRSVKKQRNPNQKYWWNVAIDGQRIEVVATNKDEAWDKATDEYQEWMRFSKNQAVITPLRPYTEPNAPTQNSQQGNWGFWITSLGRFAREPGQTDNNVLRRFNSYADAELFRTNTPGIRSDIEIREIEPTQRQGGVLSQADAERRMGIPDQTGDANWEIISNRTSRRVFVMIANTEYDARRKYADWLSASGIPIETDDYRFRPIRTNDNFGAQENRGDLTPRGPGPWEIYRISDGSTVRPLDHTNRQAAEQEARSALGLRGEAPELYGVRTRQQRMPEFTGNWQIVVGGQEVHQFGGVGNSQHDANNYARNWIARQDQAWAREHQGEGVEVLPVMR